MSKVRVRFAPSPTGPLHLGGVRTALYDYLFAKNKGGDFVLRIEDTDTARYVEGAEEYIMQALEWCGIIPDESPKHGGNYGPYRQSERRPIYDNYTEQILKTDYAYLAFDTPEELDAARAEAEANGEVFSYNYFTRNRMKNSISLSKEDVQKLLEAKTPYVVRFKMPLDRIINLEDIIRGKFSVNTNTLDDKVLVKNDGMPTYHFANIIDDYEMKITHVIRGEEWLPSMPLHVLLYEAMGWKAPEFAHLSLILKPDPSSFINKETIKQYAQSFTDDFILKNQQFNREEVQDIITNIFINIKNFSSQIKIKENDTELELALKNFLKKSLSGKLSKRDGAKFGFPVFPMNFYDAITEETYKGYKEEGYLPEAFVNFLALLGWSPSDDKEILSLEEMATEFDLHKVHKAGARFSKEKAEWFNHQYLQRKSNEEVLAIFKNLEETKNISLSDETLLKIIDLMKERASFVKDIYNEGKFFFEAPLSYDEKASKKAWNEETSAILEVLITKLEALEDFSSERIKEEIHHLVEEKGLGFGKVMMPLRLSLVGELKGPDVPDLVEILGKAETIDRIKAAIEILK